MGRGGGRGEGGGELRKETFCALSTSCSLRVVIQDDQSDERSASPVDVKTANPGHLQALLTQMVGDGLGGGRKFDDPCFWAVQGKTAPGLRPSSCRTSRRLWP